MFCHNPYCNVDRCWSRAQVAYFCQTGISVTPPMWQRHEANPNFSQTWTCTNVAPRCTIVEREGCHFCLPVACNHGRSRPCVRSIRRSGIRPRSPEAGGLLLGIDYKLPFDLSIEDILACLLQRW